MTLMKKQLIVWLVTALCISVCSFWYGESPKKPFTGFYLMVIYSIPLLIVLMLVLNIFIKQKWFVHFFVGLLFFGVNAVAFLYGSSSARNAFNDCVENGEKVRTGLQYFYEKHKTYPETLAELNIELPGRLILNPDLLRYTNKETGYLLSFSDGFVGFNATELQPFEGKK